MKTRSALLFLIIVLTVTLFSTAVSANSEILDWPASVETKEITVIQDGDPICYRFVPTETREYAIKYPSNVPLGYEFRTSNDEVVEFWNWIDDNNNFCDIYTLTAGTEYILTLFYGGEPSPEGKYTGNISIVPWENKLELPDYPYLQDNQKVTYTVTEDLCEYFLYSPAQSGTYCIGRNTSCLRISLSPVVKTPNDMPHEPEHLGDWRTDTMQGDLYRLEEGNIYLICIEGFGVVPGETITDTVWIRPGEAPKNEYPIWSISDSKTVTLKKDEIAKFYLTPSESGKYMVRTPESIRIEVIDGPDMLGTAFSTSDGVEGYVYDLQAGKQYTVMLQEWASEHGTETGTFKFEKVGAVKSASIYVANFHSDTYFLGIDIDPICGGLEGVTWSVSDPSVFSFVSTHDNGAELQILKNGKATVTAKVGNVSTSIELTAPGKLPVLTEGKTLNLTIGGTAAEFTPTKSGKYQFTVTPNRSMLFSVYENVEEDPLYFKEEFSEQLVFSLNLDAGITYELVQLFGRSTVSVKYTGGTASQGGATAPTVAPTQPETTVPSSPATAPTDATEAPTTPTEITEPTVTETTPTAGDTDTPIGSVLITAEDITKEDLIAFENTESAVFQISADALRLAAEQGTSLSLDFPSNVNVVLYNNILQSLCEDTADEYITVSVTPKTYYDLNADQQAALEGKSLVMLLDMTLSFDGINIHELGGNAQITLPNPDSNKDWQILYLADDGSVEILEITGDEEISFSTDHFSKYALVFAQKDGTDSNLILWICIGIGLLLIGGGTAAFFIIRKKKRQ